jgi:TRAP-type C4-dicarboxylate transport system permease small subunit
MDHFTKLVHRTGRTVAIIGGGLLVGLMLLTVANIIYRFFGGVIIGSFELIELTIVPIAGFSLVYAGMWHTHVTVKILVVRFPERIQGLMKSFAALLGIGIWGLMAWNTAEFFLGKRFFDETELLGVLLWPFRYAWVLGLFIFTLVILIDFYRGLYRGANK